jgi:hypothetical protein
MLAAIHLDHHTRVVANEISDKGSNRNLPAKLEVCKSPITQRKPELALCIGHA